MRPLHYFDVNKTLISTLTPQLDEAKVESMYNWYTKRLHECERRDRQMTRYQLGGEIERF